jgi:hypothetical protein
LWLGCRLALHACTSQLSRGSCLLLLLLLLGSFCSLLLLLDL